MIPSKHEHGRHMVESTPHPIGYIGEVWYCFYCKTELDIIPNSKTGPEYRKAKHNARMHLIKHRIEMRMML